jgi:hypothetical protein
MEGQYSEGNYGDAGASPEALKEDAGGDYTAGDYAEKTVPSPPSRMTKLQARVIRRAGPSRN